MKKIWICLNKCFYSKPQNWINITKNGFFPQSEPNTAKLCLSVALKNFGGNS